MSISNPLIGFSAYLLLGLGVAFGLHLAILNFQGLPLFGNMLVLSYVVNFLLAGVIFASLYLFRYRLKNHIGFLFMGGSMLKFLFFFLIFYPPYKVDGKMDKLEFAAFFVPYAICLVLETVFIAKMLKKLY